MEALELGGEVLHEQRDERRGLLARARASTWGEAGPRDGREDVVLADDDGLGKVRDEHREGWDGLHGSGHGHLGDERLFEEIQASSELLRRGERLAHRAGLEDGGPPGGLGGWPHSQRALLVHHVGVEEAGEFALGDDVDLVHGLDDGVPDAGKVLLQHGVQWRRHGLDERVAHVRVEAKDLAHGGRGEVGELTQLDALRPWGVARLGPVVDVHAARGAHDAHAEHVPVEGGRQVHEESADPHDPLLQHARGELARGEELRVDLELHEDHQRLQLLEALGRLHEGPEEHDELHGALGAEHQHPEKEERGDGVLGRENESVELGGPPPEGARHHYRLGHDKGGVDAVDHDERLVARVGGHHAEEAHVQEDGQGPVPVEEERADHRHARLEPHAAQVRAHLHEAGEQQAAEEVGGRPGPQPLGGRVEEVGDHHEQEISGHVQDPQPRVAGEDAGPAVHLAMPLAAIQARRPVHAAERGPALVRRVVEHGDPVVGDDGEDALGRPRHLVHVVIVDAHFAQDLGPRHELPVVVEARVARGEHVAVERLHVGLHVGPHRRVRAVGGLGAHVAPRALEEKAHDLGAEAQVARLAPEQQVERHLLEPRFKAGHAVLHEDKLAAAVVAVQPRGHVQPALEGLEHGVVQLRGRGDFVPAAAGLVVPKLLQVLVLRAHRVRLEAEGGLEVVEDVGELRDGVLGHALPRGGALE
mmetsp:Transcript_26338/g.77303  ORF Transcript_26338/g.77303 Transcript_26338/m.77303 type:complete len:703 (-) Transcript_26338:2540-4648(-)